MFGPEQFCCLIPDIFKYENRCIILLGKKGSRGWLDCCTPVKLSAGRVGRLHQRSGRISGGFWIPCVGRCSLITLVTSPSSRGWVGFYQPICQTQERAKFICNYPDKAGPVPQAKASCSRGQKLNHVISREFVV